MTTEPELTEAQRFALYVLAGCETETVLDEHKQSWVFRLKNPVGTLWTGERWLIAEKRS